MFHKSSGTLLLVDAAVCVPRSPPPIVPKWALQDAGGSSFFVRLLYGNVSAKQVLTLHGCDSGDRCCSYMCAAAAAGCCC